MTTQLHDHSHLWALDHLPPSDAAQAFDGGESAHSLVSEFAGWFKPLVDKGAWAIATHTIATTVFELVE